MYHEKWSKHFLPMYHKIPSNVESKHSYAYNESHWLKWSTLLRLFFTDKKTSFCNPIALNDPIPRFLFRDFLKNVEIFSI